MGTKQKVKNEGQHVKGKAKELAGRSTGNAALERKGRSDQAKATVKDLGERAKDAARSVTARTSEPR